MSLLDTGPDTVTVHVQAETFDWQGNPVLIPGDPVTLQARVQPVSSDEVADIGQGTSTVYRVISRSLPKGAYSLVEWDGRQWDVIGEPRQYNGSTRTRHMDLLIRARNGYGV